jgi:toxin ParE1/3/4
MPERTLSAYRFTPAAQSDLADIWSYTAQTWSAAQADAYVSGIRKTLGILLDSPEIARERTEIIPSVRIHRHRSHIIVYRIEIPYLAVIRIRHGREDWMDDPIGGAGEE